MRKLWICEVSPWTTHSVFISQVIACLILSLRFVEKRMEIYTRKNIVCDFFSNRLFSPDIFFYLKTYPLWNVMNCVVAQCRNNMINEFKCGGVKYG